MFSKLTVFSKKLVSVYSVSLSSLTSFQLSVGYDFLIPLLGILSSENIEATGCLWKNNENIWADKELRYIARQLKKLFTFVISKGVATGTRLFPRK